MQWEGDLHNVADDEYILIIIAGRYLHSLGDRRRKRVKNGGFPGHYSAPFSHSKLSRRLSFSVVSHRTKNYCYCSAIKISISAQKPSQTSHYFYHRKKVHKNLHFIPDGRPHMLHHRHTHTYPFSMFPFRDRKKLKSIKLIFFNDVILLLFPFLSCGIFSFFCGRISPSVCFWIFN